jgi:hypothetical protein
VCPDEDGNMEPFNGVKIFSATLAKNREELGEKATEWMKEHPNFKIVDMRVVQSSDREFHCISLLLFYRES